MTQTEQQEHSPFVLAEQAKRAQAFQLRSLTRSRRLPVR
jgi:hypothetical protein